MTQLSKIFSPTFFEIFNSTFFLVHSIVDAKGVGTEINVLLLDLLLDDKGKPTENVTLQTTSQSSIYPPNTIFQGSKFLTQGYNQFVANSAPLHLEAMLEHTKKQYNLIQSRSQPAF